ncbi:MAG: hypothetical protein ACRCXZ_08750, partial [Patescibacteria group bacterium]
YKKFFADKYHPANSIILVYGKLDESEENKVLENINSYLNNFQPSNLLPIVTLSKPFDARKTITKYYQSQEGNENVYSNIVYRFESTITGTIASLISSAFFSDTRDCYKEIMASGFVERVVNVGVENDLVQPYLLFATELKTKEKSNEILKIIENHISKAINEGIDVEYLNGLINRMEYAYIENLDNNAFGTINEFARRFGKDEEFLNINYYDIIDKVKDVVLDQSKLKEFLQINFISNKNVVISEFHPDPEFNKKREDQEKERLVTIQSKLTSKEIDDIKQKSELIQKGKVEDENVIPRLQTSDLETTLDESPLVIKKNKNFDFITSKELDKDTCHINIIFGVDENFNKKDLYFLDLIFSKFFDFPTKDLDSIKLENYLKNNLGSYSASVNMRMDGKIVGGISFGLLKNKLSSVEYILEQLLGKRHFDQKEVLLNMIHNSLGHLQYMLKNESEEIIAERLNKEIYQTDYYRFYSMKAQETALLLIKDRVNSDFENLVKDLERVFLKFKEDLRISVSYLGPRDQIEQVEDIIHQSFDDLNTLPYKPDKLEYSFKESSTELIEHNSQDIVNFHRQIININDLKVNPGILYLFSKIATFEYLWQEVRSKGGAYGVGLRYLEASGLFSAYTFRDPRGTENLDFVHKALKFMSKVKLDEKSFESYKISTVNSYAPYKNVESQFFSQTRNYFGNRNDIDHQNKVYIGILNATQEDIREVAKELLDFPIFKAVSYRIKK